MKKLYIVLLSFIFLCAYSSQAQNCVDFQSLTFGTQYGNPGGSAGDLIFAEDNIPVSIDSFYFIGPGGAFNFCRVDTLHVLTFGPSKNMAINNVNLIFNLANLPFTANLVTFDFADYGGHENISVNGAPIFAGEFLSAPSPIAPGVTMSVAFTNPINPKIGTVTLRGQVSKLLVGGQELWLDNICASDTIISGVTESVLDGAQQGYHLAQNFPNPFSNFTEIQFQLPKESQIELEVYNRMGQLVQTLISACYAPGTYAIVWDGKDENSIELPSGTYFYRLRTDDFEQVQSMLLLK